MVTQPTDARQSLGVILLLCAAALLLAGCGPARTAEQRAEHSILFWHDWQAADAVFLTELLVKYQDFDAATGIVEQAVPADELYARYVTNYEEGIEPDMILADWITAQDLIRKGYIKDLSSLIAAGAFDLNDFDPGALSVVSSGGAVYGIPFSLSTQMLFYNTDHVPTAPETLDELMLLLAERDIQLGLNAQFVPAYWGIRLFGGRPYDANGKLDFDEGAFVNWLTTLRNIQTNSGFMLSNDQSVLRAQFLDGSLELYIASAREYQDLYAVMGPKLGVTRLPVSAIGNPSGPIQESSLLLISANAGAVATERALQLAQFLTNPQQQVLLTSGEIGRLPANQSVRIAPSMNHLVVETAKQLRSAVPISLDQRAVWNNVSAQAQALYSSVLEGVIDIYTGVDEVRSLVNGAQEDEQSQAAANAALCPTITQAGPLTLTLWHGWADPETEVLDELITEFNALCPAIRLSAERDTDNRGLNERYRAAVAAGGGPDLLLDSTEFLATLAAADQIRPLSDVVDPTRLTQFVPSTVQAMRHNGQLYGYPEGARSIALIYNPTLIASPPQTLDDLLLQVNLENQFAMPLTFFYDFWGLGAFGGQLFDSDGRATLDDGGMAEWLQWLQAAAARPGFAFTDARPAAEELFIAGEAAFLVSGPWSLPRLYANMPQESIAVTMLPAGPRNVAGPILEVEAFMFNPRASDDTVQAGLAFARFVTSRANQQRLLATGVHVPANVTVDTSDNPIITGFRNQMHTAYPAVQDEYWNVALADGDAVYRATVQEGADIQQAVAEFNRLINEVNAGLEQEEQPQ